ncbi:MAG: hypothetical protein RR444_12340 [Oscillospiraceae bacterium]
MKKTLTNYDLVTFMINSISTDFKKFKVTKENEPVFFALYTLLLQKIFGVDMTHCKELIAIYCVKRTASETDGVELFSVVVDFVQDFDYTWEDALASTDDDSLLNNPLYCLAKVIQETLPEYNDYDIYQNFELCVAMSSFVHNAQTLMNFFKRR